MIIILFIHLFSYLLYYLRLAPRTPLERSDLICANKCQIANTDWICGNNLALKTDWTFGSCTGLSKSQTHLWSGQQPAWSGGCSSGCCCPSPLWVCSSRGNRLRSHRGGVRWRTCRSRGYSSCWDSPAGQRGSPLHFQNLKKRRIEWWALCLVKGCRLKPYKSLYVKNICKESRQAFNWFLVELVWLMCFHNVFCYFICLLTTFSSHIYTWTEICFDSDDNQRLDFLLLKISCFIATLESLCSIIHSSSVFQA